MFKKCLFSGIVAIVFATCLAIAPLSARAEGPTFTTLTENFNSISIGQSACSIFGGSQSGVYQGSAGIDWSYNKAEDVDGWILDWGIDDDGILMVNNVNANIKSSEIEGRINSVSVQLRAACELGYTRKLSLEAKQGDGSFVTLGILNHNFQGWQEVYTWTLNDLDLEGDIVLRLNNDSEKSVVVDNFTINGLFSGYDNFDWRAGEYGECSQAVCDGGVKTREVGCFYDNEVAVDEIFCDNDEKPVAEEACNTDACVYQWTTTEWSACSKLCGGGSQTREVGCIRTNDQTVVGAEFCGQDKPATEQACNVQSCYYWNAGEFGKCKPGCGGCVRTRDVRCYNELTKNLALNKLCPVESKPAVSEACALETCMVFDWVAKENGTCDCQILSTTITRCQQNMIYVCRSKPTNSANWGAPVAERYCVTPKPANYVNYNCIQD